VVSPASRGDDRCDGYVGVRNLLLGVLSYSSPLCLSFLSPTSLRLLSVCLSPTSLNRLLHLNISKTLLQHKAEIDAPDEEDLSRFT
jgi:hypothetical protein